MAARWKFGTGRPGDAFVIKNDVLPPGQPLRASKEITENNAVTLGNYNGLNLRADFRRDLGLVNLVLFLDVVNIYGGPLGQPPEFNPRTGNLVDDDEGAFPIIGIILEKSW